MTLDEAKQLKIGQVLHHTINRNADGTPQRWRVNGAVKVWKRNPNRVRVWTCLSDYGGDGIVGVANQRYYKAEYGLQLMYLHTASFTVIRLQDWRRLTIWQLEEIADMLERREFPGEDLISDVEYEWLRESLDFNKYEIEKKLEQWADIAAIWDNMTLEKQTDLYVSAVYDAEVEIVPEYSSVYVCDLEVVGALIPAKLATSNPVSS